MNNKVTAQDVVSFWFDAGPKKWFTTDDAFDASIEEQFASTVEAAGTGMLDDWQATPLGSLALVLLLDQFTRNLNRGKPETWKYDAKALSISMNAIAAGQDMELPAVQRRFFYMPYMHAEDVGAQALSVKYSARTEDEDHSKYARHHMDIVARFGRFPHRNTVLGRSSTKEELAYLADGGFGG